MGTFDRDRLPSSQTHTHQKDQIFPDPSLQPLCDPLVCGLQLGDQHMAGGVQTFVRHLLGEAGQLTQLLVDLAAHVGAFPNLRLGQPALLQQLQRLPRRHAADPVCLGELTLGRQPLSGGKHPLLDLLLEQVTNLYVKRRGAV